MITAKQKRIVKALEGGLTLTPEPFKKIAEKAGISEDELLAQLREWKADGVIRRFGAFLRHHHVGYSANAMSVWNVPDDQVEQFGRLAASFDAVSHCYKRPKIEGFDYNMYAMIHAKSPEECESIANRIAKKTGVSNYLLLYTKREFKKSSPVFFTDILGADHEKI